jgi:hypothetical protein
MEEAATAAEVTLVVATDPEVIVDSAAAAVEAAIPPVIRLAIPSAGSLAVTKSNPKVLR